MARRIAVFLPFVLLLTASCGGGPGWAEGEIAGADFKVVDAIFGVTDLGDIQVDVSDAELECEHLAVYRGEPEGIGVHPSRRLHFILARELTLHRDGTMEILGNQRTDARTYEHAKGCDSDCEDRFVADRFTIDPLGSIAPGSIKRSDAGTATIHSLSTDHLLLGFDVAFPVPDGTITGEISARACPTS